MSDAQQSVVLTLSRRPGIHSKQFTFWIIKQHQGNAHSRPSRVCSSRSDNKSWILHKDSIIIIIFGFIVIGYVSWSATLFHYLNNVLFCIYNIASLESSIISGIRQLPVLTLKSCCSASFEIFQHFFALQDYVSILLVEFVLWPFYSQVVSISSSMLLLHCSNPIIYLSDHMMVLCVRETVSCNLQRNCVDGCVHELDFQKYKIL